MSKITIVSRPDQHLLIDINGCLSFKDAIEQLSAALLSANQFWQGTTVDINLGKLLLNKVQLTQIIALAKGVGICVERIFAEHPETTEALKELEIVLAIAVNNEEATHLSSVAVLSDTNELDTHEKVAVPSETEYSQPMESLEHEHKNNMHLDGNIEQTVLLDGKDNSTNEQEMDKAVSVVEQDVHSSGKRQSLYIKQTLRAGQAVSHKGDLIVIGDVNAGAEVFAEGDIVIWGSLRGIAHAGVGGNVKAEIRALRLQPIQLRIAHYIARSPDALLNASSSLTSIPFLAETAKLVDGKIRILRETFD